MEETHRGKVEPITLRREGGKLITETKGNLPALLTLDGEALYNPGSGGPVAELYNWPSVQAVVA